MVRRSIAGTVGEPARSITMGGRSPTLFRKLSLGTVVGLFDGRGEMITSNIEKGNPRCGTEC
jgi:hypothetical protein